MKKSLRWMAIVTVYGVLLGWWLVTGSDEAEQAVTLIGWLHVVLCVFAVVVAEVEAFRTSPEMMWVSLFTNLLIAAVFAWGGSPGLGLCLTLASLAVAAKRWRAQRGANPSSTPAAESASASVPSVAKAGAAAVLRPLREEPSFMSDEDSELAEMGPEENPIQGWSRAT